MSKKTVSLKPVQPGQAELLAIQFITACAIIIAVVGGLV